MDGLEAVELKFSEILEDNETVRIDSEYFKKALIDFYKTINDFEKLGSFVKSGYRVVYENTKILEVSKEDEHLYTRFLQASDLLTPEIIVDNIGFVDNTDWERYPKGRIEKGELLIEVKGKAEKVAIVYDDVPEKTLVSGSLFKLKVNNKISREYLLAFLLCRYGAMFKDRSKTNLLISYISKPDLYNIPIPTVSIGFQNEISELIKQSHIVLNESKNLYKEAESLLLKELDLVDFTPSDENISIKSLKDSFMQTGRLDSEYYQAKYDELIDHIKKANFDKLDNIVNIKKSIEPGSEAYQDSGIPFIRVSNVTKFGISDTDIYLSRNILKEEELQKLYPTKDTILLSKDGTVGIAYKIKNETEIITSGALLHLTIKKDNLLPEYLTLVLNSLIVQLQAQRDAGGSIIQHWKPSEIQEVLIPIIDISIQNQIEEKIKKSFELKEDSKQLLDLAKKAVEIAIEKDENEAIKIINEEII